MTTYQANLFSNNFKELHKFILFYINATEFGIFQANPNEFWIESREDYDRLCNLCKTLDSCLSMNVLVSFACNLFFILVQLFNSLKYTHVVNALIIFLTLRLLSDLLTKE